MTNFTSKHGHDPAFDDLIADGGLPEARRVEDEMFRIAGPVERIPHALRDGRRGDTVSDPLCGIPRAAALCHLAEVIAYTQAALEGRLHAWHPLTFSEKHIYYDAAARVIAELPPVVSQGSSPDSSESVGSAARPGSLFDVAADLARTAGARVLAFGPDPRD